MMATITSSTTRTSRTSMTTRTTSTKKIRKVDSSGRKTSLHFQSQVSFEMPDA
jgi:Cu/Ag efflux protein CusF